MSKFGAVALIVASFCAASAVPAQSGNNSAEPTKILRGSVSYRQRLALPPDAVVHVAIEDVSGPGGTPKPLAEAEIPTHGHQVPIKFEVRYDPADINPEHRYQLNAKITSGNRLMFTSTAAYPVLTQGAPEGNVAVDLEQVSAQYGQHPSDAAAPTRIALIGTEWTLTELNGKAPESLSRQAYIKLDDKTQRVEGSGGCNRVMGSYEWSGRTLRFKQVATTMMACVGEVANQERDFLAALGATESYRIHNATLTLLDKKGKPLARLEARDESTPTQPQ